ncbi:MAG: IS66 family transposase [Steroidobacteraceae bacterium]
MSGQHKRHRPRKPPQLKVSQEELTAIVTKAEAALSVEESGKLKAAVALIGFLRTEIDAKTLCVERFQRMIFGATTEKTAAVLGEAQGQPPADTTRSTARAARPARAGHGRNGASVYTGARRVKIPHPRLSGADLCPGCSHGKVYPCAEPAQAVRIEAMAPLSATVYERDRLRCNLCGEVYTAPAPAGVGEDKYDETVPAMIGMLKYGAGLPFNRIERLQAGMGVPLPAATQWDLVKVGAEKYVPVHEELIRQAAQDALVHNDDTTMKILHLTREQRAAALGNDAAESRTGVFTSGIVAVGAGRKIALFFTGVRHAGENLDEVLRRRSTELPPPIHMCDGLAANEPKEFETLLARCLAHSRRRYVELAESFPEEVRFVLETLREVYRIDADARKQGLDDEHRLQLHQKHSKPLMERLEKWMQAQFAERRVEPNSTLGEAIQYMSKHWSALTLFLRAAGAPLDNNVCERVLKKAVLHRKNSLFYKTMNGARVGDIFMSLIHTAELAGVDVFDYLVALARHASDADARPADWMPWNYRESLAGLSRGPPA